MTPEAFAQIAAVSKDIEPKLKAQAPVLQGSDGQKPEKKKIKKTAN
jgi:hypothetical protein